MIDGQHTRVSDSSAAATPLHLRVAVAAGSGAKADMAEGPGRARSRSPGSHQVFRAGRGVGGRGGHKRTFDQADTVPT